MSNIRGQALIEALLVGALCILGLFYIFDTGQKIIKSTIENEKLEEQFLQNKKF